MKDLKEENEQKGKVIAIQQKLLEIAVQMFQEKKEECEELKKQNERVSNDYFAISTRLKANQELLEWTQMRFNNQVSSIKSLQDKNEELTIELQRYTTPTPKKKDEVQKDG